MKIFFNSAFKEDVDKREAEDLWVKYNNGNTLDVYFEGLNLREPTIKARIIIRWPSGKTTNELPLMKHIGGEYFKFTMPILEEEGVVNFTIKIYETDETTRTEKHSHTAIFNRVILDSVDPSDETNITSAEYQELLKSIEELQAINDVTKVTWTIIS